MPGVFATAEIVEDFAKRLIPAYHPELATARIAYVFAEKASMKNGRPVYGKVKKVSGSAEFLLEKDFVIEVGLDKWNELSEAARTALVDHLLERCFGEEDPEDAGAPMKWTVREPDVMEFTTILRRHGIWHEDLTGFVQVAHEINLDHIVAEATTTATAEATVATDD